MAQLRAMYKPLSLVLHIGLIVGANLAAVLLRFDGTPPAAYWQLWREALPWLVVIRMVVFVPFRIHHGMWRYTSLSTLRNIVLAVATSSAAFVVIEAARGVAYPRSIALVDALVLVCLMGGVRLAWKPRRETFTRRSDRRVLVYGAGDAGAHIVRNMKESPQFGYRPVGFVDDDPAKRGERIHDVPILGTPADMLRIIGSTNATEVLIAIPGADSAALRAIVQSLQPLKIAIKMLPTLREIVDGRADVKQIRSLAIEDLLPRAPIGLDREPLKRLIEGRRVLVTGAGGSIGSELCRQIAGLRPARLIMVDRYENTLHAIRIELDDRRHTFSIIPVIADVTDDVRINAVLAEHQPEIVFHAAAHKHVPLMEENPCEAVKNNVRGTRLLVQAAEAHGVDRFIMVSTDKAVNPTSVMGASKRIAELVVQAQAAGSGTSFSIVRFGNVLGSNGSVVPRFLDQIRKGGPVTVTHPDMRRFFMLIPEAVQLVLHAASQAESGAIYVLEMGEQVKLADLARDLIRLSGLDTEEGIKIEYTGLRPGEKLYEELVGSSEEVGPSAVEKIQCVRSIRQPDARLFTDIELLERAAADGKGAVAIDAMQNLIGTFKRAEDTGAAPPPRPVLVPEMIAVPTASWNDRPCPSCGSGRAHRSPSRTRLERKQKMTTAARLFKCDACDWRGWLDPLPAESAAGALTAPPDLTTVDATVWPLPAAGRPNFSPRDLK